MQWKSFEEANQGKHFCQCPKCLKKGPCRETAIEIKKHHKQKGIPKYKRGHYTSVYAQSRDLKGEKSNSWRGGRYIDLDGYVLIFKPDHPNARKTGYVLEHRLVMEQQLGRLLERQEVVHHKRGRADNDPEDLELFSSNGEHLKVELAEKRNCGELYKKQSFLVEEYLNKNRSLADIGSQFGVSVQAVFRFVKKFGLKKTTSKVNAARTNYIIQGYIKKREVL